MQKKALGEVLYKQVISYHLDLIEVDYFGLQFMDTNQVRYMYNKKTCLIFQNLFKKSIFGFTIDDTLSSKIHFFCL